MRRILAATTATLLTASMLASPALAGGLSGSGSVSGDASVGGASVSGEASGSASVGVDSDGIDVDVDGTASGSAGGEASGSASVDVDGASANVSGEASGTGNARATGSAAGAASADIDDDASADVDLGTTASTRAGTSFGAAVSSIRTGRMTAADIDAIDGRTSVRVARLGATARGRNAVTLNNAIEANADAIAMLQSSIAGNASLSAALEAGGIDVSSVVAATVNADGSVTVFTR
jgi:hypothetical protein